MTLLFLPCGVPAHGGHRHNYTMRVHQYVEQEGIEPSYHDVPHAAFITG